MAKKSGKSQTAAKPAPTPAILEVSDEERELLVRILQRHRSTLPTYLLSMKREIELLDDLLRKLAAS